MNLLSFLPAGEYKTKGNGEYAGPCPRCGGTDRFVVWPDHPSGAAGGKFLCRHCAPEGGDGIQFLRDFHGMSFAEAKEALRLPPSSAGQRMNSARAAVAWEAKEARTPSEAWQSAATTFLSDCCKHIECEAAAAFLQSRGLSLDTACRFHLGWNLADRWDVPKAWGLEPWTNSKGNPGRVSLPAGLVIPVFRKSGIMALNIRRAVVPEGRAKYHLAKGSAAVAFVHGKAGLPLVIVEGELCAVTIAQEAPGICSVVALPAGNRPDTQTAAFISAAPDALYAGDFDDAGKDAFGWWREHFSCRAWPPAAGKDISDMHQAGVSVRAWIELGIAQERGGKTPRPSAVQDTWEAHWRSLCPDYWKGCMSLPGCFPCPHGRANGRDAQLEFLPTAPTATVGHESAAREAVAMNGAILLEAHALINGERQASYGSPAPFFTRTAALWSAYLGHAVTGKDVAMCMALLKFSREANHHKPDNLLDAAGYIGLAADMEGGQ